MASIYRWRGDSKGKLDRRLSGLGVVGQAVRECFPFAARFDAMGVAARSRVMLNEPRTCVWSPSRFRVGFKGLRSR